MSRTAFPTRDVTIGRKDFIRRWMHEAGVSYDAAAAVYRVMVSIFEDGVANGQKITISQLGALVPYWQNSQTKVMPFRRIKGGIVRQKQEYNLDPRIKYKFKIYRAWLNRSHLNWHW
jgi:hypothetical protein